MGRASNASVQEDIAFLDATLQLHRARCEEEQIDEEMLSTISNHTFSTRDLERLATMYISGSYSAVAVEEALGKAQRPLEAPLPHARKIFESAAGAPTQRHKAVEGWSKRLIRNRGHMDGTAFGLGLGGDADVSLLLHATLVPLGALFQRLRRKMDPIPILERPSAIQRPTVGNRMWSHKFEVLGDPYIFDHALPIDRIERWESLLSSTLMRCLLVAG